MLNLVDGVHYGEEKYSVKWKHPFFDENRNVVFNGYGANKREYWILVYPDQTAIVRFIDNGVIGERVLADKTIIPSPSPDSVSEAMDANLRRMMIDIGLVSKGKEICDAVERRDLLYGRYFESLHPLPDAEFVENVPKDWNLIDFFYHSHSTMVHTVWLDQEGKYHKVVVDNREFRSMMQAMQQVRDYVD